MFDSGMKLDQPKQDQLKHVKIPEIHTMGVLGGELYVIGGDGVSQVIKAGFQIAALEHVKISEEAINATTNPFGGTKDAIEMTMTR